MQCSGSSSPRRRLSYTQRQIHMSGQFCKKQGGWLLTKIRYCRYALQLILPRPIEEHDRKVG